ncbi:MAG: hypothetical protein M1829_000977 [Trizodia sp. TS-e1964]|nr:MAG: hypothetical protein M1829_000977 [Trizodia sp. TS-e1964]
MVQPCIPTQFMQQNLNPPTIAPAGNPRDLNGLCLLSLDGGGVRGLSTLLILKRLIDRTNDVRKSRGLDPAQPHELFDLIGGTSTGG